MNKLNRGECENKFTSFIRLAFNPYLSTVILDKFFADDQSKAGSFLI